MDGAGKTFLRETMRPRLEAMFRDQVSLRIAHVKPPLFTDSEPDPNGVFSTPQSLEPHPAWKSALKIVYYATMYWVQLLALSTNRRQHVILYDRYLTDAWADPVRYCLPSLESHLIWRWFMNLVPLPDLNIFIKVPPEVAVARKGELTLQQADKLGQSYTRLYEKLSKKRVSLLLCNDEQADINDLSDHVVTQIEKALTERGWTLSYPKTPRKK